MRGRNWWPRRERLLSGTTLYARCFRVYIPTTIHDWGTRNDSRLTICICNVPHVHSFLSWGYKEGSRIAVIAVAKLRAGRLGEYPVFHSRQGQCFFHFSTGFKVTLGYTQPPIQCVSRAVSPAVKRLDCEADHVDLTLVLRMCTAVIYSPIRLHQVYVSQGHPI
jgi:hypothetical protein